MRIAVCVLAILVVGALSGLAAGADWMTYGPEYGYEAGWSTLEAPAYAGYELGALVPGCCECPPSCCEHVWDGYCQKKRCHHGFGGCHRGCGSGCQSGCGTHGCGGCKTHRCGGAGCGGCKTHRCGGAGCGGCGCGADHPAAGAVIEEGSAPAAVQP